MVFKKSKGIFLREFSREEVFGDFVFLGKDVGAKNMAHIDAITGEGRNEIAAELVAQDNFVFLGVFIKKV